MENSAQSKILSALIVVALVIGVGFLVAKGKFTKESQTPVVENTSDVTVENSQMLNGMLSLPAGFPSDIPIEKANVTESATTNFKGQPVRQLSVNYETLEAVSEKYAEYKAYMSQAGYEVTEGNPQSPVRSISGTKAEANLSVVISSLNNKTLVQIAYLIKSL